MAYQRIMAINRCPTGRGTFVEIAGHELAVFHLADKGRFAVIDNACPHANGNLSGGELTGCVVSCPWHHWEFDVTTGVCIRSDMAKLTRYPVRLQGDSIHADLQAPL